MANKGDKGRVKYLGRAFLQDAQDAMRGDIVRGLIELITNSDDALGDNKGRILVEIDPRRDSKSVIVRDRAKGMRSDWMKQAIGELGGRTSGFAEGKEVRGNLGRGAKDCAAFGRVTFESICEGYFSKFILHQNGEYDRPKERRVTEVDKARLGIQRGNGTVVTVKIEHVSLPRIKNIEDKLSKHYQLRDIFSDSKREVFLSDITKNEKTKIRYNYPDLPIVFSETLEIDGYPDARAEVTIYRNKERYDDPPTEAGRPAGLLIKGRKSIYDNTLFKFDSQNPHAGWFSGEVKCEYIDTIVNEFDFKLVSEEPPEKSNPMAIISRRRDGLQRNHPFYKSLAKAIEKPLGDLIAEEEKKAKESSARESIHLRKSLDALGRELAKLINEDLSEIDEEDIIGGAKGDDNIPPITLIPEHSVLYIGENKTITVYVKKEIEENTASLELDPGGVVEFIDGNLIDLVESEKRPTLLVGRIRLKPILEEEETMLTVECGDCSTVSLLEVRPEREEVETEVEPPESLQFERDIYRIAWTKRKHIRIIAPLEVVNNEGNTLRITSSDEGVVVIGGQIELKLDDEVEYYFADVTVEARTLGIKTKLTAKLGAINAQCTVIVSRHEEGPGLKFEIADEEAGYRRALVDKVGDQTLIKIMGRHPVLKRYLGPAPDFPNQDRVLSRNLIAEIIAGEAARMVLEKKYKAGSGGGLFDAASMFPEYSSYLSRYLMRCHKALISDSAIANTVDNNKSSMKTKTSGKPLLAKH